MPPESMQPADAWLRIARSELAAADGPHDPDALPGVYCYLAQQAVEKALKAVLVHRGAEPPRIHEIQALLVEIGDHTFCADGIYLGGARIHRGTATLAW